MPYFDFSLIGKKKKSNNNTKTNSKRIKRWTIVEKNVEAIVGFTDDLQYIAMLRDGRDYLIDDSCYNGKGHRELYSQILFGEYKQCVVISRVPMDAKNHFPYLPFAIGCIILGTIIKDNINNIETFKIKKCWRDYDNWDSVTIINCFKAMYNEEVEQRIIDNYIKRINEKL